MAIHCTKTVYDPPESQDGCRLIIMRRYPRGIAKSRAHAWVPQLESVIGVSSRGSLTTRLLGKLA